jgi:hypothetical protein
LSKKFKENLEKNMRNKKKSINLRMEKWIKIFIFNIKLKYFNSL